MQQPFSSSLEADCSLYLLLFNSLEPDTARCTVVINKKLTFRFRSTIVERCVLSKKRTRNNHAIIRNTVRYAHAGCSKGHDRLTGGEHLELLKTGYSNQTVVLRNDRAL